MGKIKTVAVLGIWLGLIVLEYLGGAMPAVAIGDGSVNVSPAITKEYPDRRSWFVYEALPGTIIKDKVEIKNQAKTAMNVRVAVLDGATTNDGGYTLVGIKEENKDIGTWANLSDETVTLPPGGRKLIDLTIQVPANADVGSHPGGVVIWQDKSSTAKKSGGMLSIVTRLAARLYLTVPGDIIRELEISNVSHSFRSGVLYFSMTFQNKGNVTLLPEADIKLQGIFGNIGEQIESQFGMILRGGKIDSQVPWQKRAPKIGRFVAEFRVHYGEKDFKGEFVKDEYQDVRYVFWIMPWMMIMWWVLGILLLLFIRKFWTWVLIRQRLNTKIQEHLVKKGESLTIIANLYGIEPKAIAKFNLLKWPYDLVAGDILLIPQGKMTKAEQKTIIRHSAKPAILSAVAFRRRPEAFWRRWGHSLRHPGPTGSKPSSDSGSPENRFRVKPGMTGGSGLEPVIAEAGDTVKTVAEFARVSTKEIIAINKLKWPYKLRAGQELFIPIVSNIEEGREKTSSKPVKIAVKSTGRKTISRLSKKTDIKPSKSNRPSPKKPKK